MSGHGGGSFQTTKWTLVVSAGDRNAPDAEAALASLCESYWRPVHAFIRRLGYSDDDARDLAQEFFTRLIERNDIGQARRERGRFRTFLLAVLKNFLANQRDARMAQKRGGGAVVMPLDELPALNAEPAADVTPESLYERQWAESTLELAFARVAARHQTPPDRRAMFDRLRPYLTGDEDQPYAGLAEELGVAQGALRVAVHRLRREVAAALHEAVGETVDRPEDTADELRFLLSILSRKD